MSGFKTATQIFFSNYKFLKKSVVVKQNKVDDSIKAINKFIALITFNI